MFMDNATLTLLARYQIKPDESHRIGIWRIVLVRELPYKESVMNGLIPKYLPHRLFPNCVYSIWTDAKLQLVVDPLLILENLLINHNVDIAMSKASLQYSYHGGSHFYSQMGKVEQRSCEISNGPLLCRWFATLEL
jgi:hypothetical protein